MMMTEIKDNQPQDQRRCHAEGERCLGCDHYYGKAPVCSYAKPEPQEQEAEPKVVAIVDKSIPSAEIQYTEAATDGLDDGTELITLQAHHEAMAKCVSLEDFEAVVKGASDTEDRYIKLVDDLHAALDACERDSKRLVWLYSGEKTGSNALLDIELRLINDDVPSIEEVRAAIDECMDTPLDAAITQAQEARG